MALMTRRERRHVNCVQSGFGLLDQSRSSLWECHTHDDAISLVIGCPVSGENSACWILSDGDVKFCPLPLATDRIRVVRHCPIVDGDFKRQKSPLFAEPGIVAFNLIFQISIKKKKKKLHVLISLINYCLLCLTFFVQSLFLSSLFPIDF